MSAPRTPIDGGTVRIDRVMDPRGTVATLTIDHPARRNAIGPAVISALTDAARTLAREDDLRAVVLRGAGGVFSAGANVKVMSGLDPAGARAFITALHHAIDAVRRLPVPVIAVLEGRCYGAAMELAAACDMRLASTAMIAGMPEVRVGLPSVIEACLLPRLIGWGKTSELLLTGRDIRAGEAERIGFVERLAPAEALDDALADWIDMVLAAAPHAVRAQKAVMAGWEGDDAPGIRASIAAFEAAYRTPEPQLGMAAFAVTAQSDGPPPAVIFDLDGTLIHSAPDLHAAANVMLAGLGRPALTLEQVTGFIGNGVPVLVERCIAATGGGSEPMALSRFSDAYDAAPTALTRAYPGVVGMLEHLAAAGARMAICTNKPEGPTRRILSDLGLERYFEAIVGGDSLPVRKPDPAPLLHAIEALGAELSETLYIGDSETDAETARRARCAFWLFTQGYRHRPAMDLPADRRFDTFDGALAMLKTLPGLGQVRP